MMQAVAVLAPFIDSGPREGSSMCTFFLTLERTRGPLDKIPNLLKARRTTQAAQ